MINYEKRYGLLETLLVVPRVHTLLFELMYYVNLLQVCSCYYIHRYKYAHNYVNFVESIVDVFKILTLYYSL